MPYSALAKAASGGDIPGIGGAIPGLLLLPATTIASLFGMIAFLGLSGWWRHAGNRLPGPLPLPAPSRWTALSGLCTAAIIATTTLAYTFEGVSIVMMMLLMRGGVLVIAPIVDRISGRSVRRESWIALVLSLSALLVGLADGDNYVITAAAGLVVAIYLLAYFGRLRLMSSKAKSSDRQTTLRYFVEEQLVATPAVVAVLFGWAAIDGGANGALLRAGFSSFWLSPALPVALLIGLLSQGTGIFGGLVLLDPRENTFSVPVNRSSSVLAGVSATLLLALVAGGRWPSHSEAIGVGLILLAILALTVPGPWRSPR